ncbi:hypothetical protein [Marinoscillum furvescens]|nr:hypothetical protein [Marinoscillum furvescens]
MRKLLTLALLVFFLACLMVGGLDSDDESEINIRVETIAKCNEV